MRIAMFGQKRIPSREGGVEIVVEELSTRMAVLGHKVTCYNRRGHHVSGSQYDTFTEKEYKNVRIKTVPTIEKKGLAAVSSSFLQHFAACLEGMMWFTYMLKDRQRSVLYLNCLGKG